MHLSQWIPHNIVFRTVELYIHRNCNLQVILRDPEAICRDEKKSQAKGGPARAYNLAETSLGPLVETLTGPGFGRDFFVASRQLPLDFRRYVY